MSSDHKLRYFLYSLSTFVHPFKVHTIKTFRHYKVQKDIVKVIHMN